MTPEQLQQRRNIVESLRLVAGDTAGLTGRVSQETAQVLIEMLDEARFVATSFVEVLDPYTEMHNEHPKKLARGLMDAINNPNPVPAELPQYFASDDVLLHVEGNDYELKPEYTSAWVAVDTLAVYICRMNGGLLVEVHPNGDEAAGRPYAKSFVEFEQPKRVFPKQPVTLIASGVTSQRTFAIDDPFDVVWVEPDGKTMYVRAIDGYTYHVFTELFE